MNCRSLTALFFIFWAWASGLAQPVPGITEIGVKTKNRVQPVLTIMLKMPPKGPAKGVLAFCTWSGEVDEIRARISRKLWGEKNDPNLVRLYNQLLDFADQNQLAVMTWTVATVWNNQKNYSELTPAELMQGDRNFDEIAAAWSSGAAKLLQAQKIPMKNILIYGLSRGAQFAHRLVLRRPQFFSAICIHINSTYEAPAPAGNKVAWLVTTGEFEVGAAGSSIFYEDAIRRGYPIIYKLYRDKAHDELPEADNLRDCFFKYVMSQPPSPTGLRFTNAPYVGDVTTDEYVPAAQQNTIEVAHRVFLPTFELAKAWAVNPASSDSNW